MSDYISREAFKKKYLCCGVLPEMSEKEFDEFPAADVEPVRNGQWISLTDCSNAGVYCSICHKKVYKEDYAWCNRKIK